MGLFDAYPTALNVETNINETLDDFCLFMWFRIWFNGSPGNAVLMSRGITDNISAHRGPADDMGGGVYPSGSPWGTYSSGPSTLTTNTWYPLIFQRRISNTTLTARINGTATNNTSCSVTSSNEGRNFRIGTNYSGGFGIMGGIVRLALYNTYLTEGEMVSLEKGFSPTRIRPQNLLVYAPFIDKKNATFGNKLIGTGGGADTFNMSNGDGLPLIGVY